MRYKKRTKSKDIKKQTSAQKLNDDWMESIPEDQLSESLFTGVESEEIEELPEDPAVKIEVYTKIDDKWRPTGKFYAYKVSELQRTIKG